MDDWLTVHHGDCREVLSTLPEESVQCVVTSPPYWGLRDYGVDGQLGLERTPDEYVAAMVDVFREVRRVLRRDGTLWLNLGDSYATGAGAVGEHPGGGAQGSAWTGMRGHRGVRAGSRKHTSGAMGPMTQPNRMPQPGLKPKDLVGIPWRVAFALQQPYYTGRIPDERDRTWLAALMDGEGTFTILSTTSSSAGSISYPPIAQVRMTSERVVAKAASMVGVVSPAQRPPSMRGTRSVYQWRLNGQRAADIARELYPYLIEKRQQALIAWNHQEVRGSYETKRGVPMPAEARAKQQVCRDLIRRLNHGERVDTPSWMVEPPAMTEPGWYLRSDVIWAKPNPMPESVTDRPTKAHEYLFLLSRSERYMYDAAAVMERGVATDAHGQTGGGYGVTPPGQKPQVGNRRKNEETGDRRKVGFNDRWDETERVAPERIGTRNRRSVWTVATQPYPGAHFATFPEALVEPCILAGCPEGGVVLDPFAGTGTVGVVAQRLSRRAVLIDLNPDYLRQLMVRNQQAPLGLGAA